MGSGEAGRGQGGGGLLPNPPPPWSRHCLCNFITQGADLAVAYPGTQQSPCPLLATTLPIEHSSLDDQIACDPYSTVFIIIMLC